jgi:hypothetical protein
MEKKRTASIDESNLDGLIYYSDISESDMQQRTEDNKNRNNRNANKQIQFQQEDNNNNNNNKLYTEQVHQSTLRIDLGVKIEHKFIAQKYNYIIFIHN